MATMLVTNNFIFMAVLAYLATVAYSQNIIKDPTPTPGLAELSAKVNDLKPDGSHYGLGYNYYGPTVPTLGLNYGHSIVGAPYTAKPYYPTPIAAGYYPQGFAVGGKPAIPYSGHIIPGYGYPTNYGYGPSIGLGYPGVLGYNGGYDQHTALPAHGYHGYQYNTGYLG